MLRAEVDTTAVDRGFDALTAAARDTGPVWKEARKPLRRDLRDHARRRQSPSGAWPAKSPLTLEREARARRRAGKKRGSGRRLLGRLPSAINVKADRNRVSAWSRARRWSHVHQDGGTAGRGARIPARVFMWASEALINVIGGLLERHILGRW